MVMTLLPRKEGPCKNSQGSTRSNERSEFEEMVIKSLPLELVIRTAATRACHTINRHDETWLATQLNRERARDLDMLLDHGVYVIGLTA